MYSISKILLISFGVGVAIYLAQEVVNNALLDLGPGSDDTSSSANTKPSSEALLRTCHRKRKHGASGFLENNDQINLEAEGLRTHPATQISVKIASLEALKTLLTVGGALRSESWRSKVDNLLITVAADYCSGGWANEQRSTLLASGPTPTCTDLQLAALDALLASLISPSRVRPPHLAQSLELFRRGRQETGTKLSEFCCYALLALEVLIHPRALPLANFPSANSSHENHGFPETLYSCGQKHDVPFSSGIQETGHGSPDSDLFESLLGASKETDSPVDGPDKDIIREKPSENLGFQWAEKISSLSTKFPRLIEEVPALASEDVEMGGFGNEIIVESQEVQESEVQLQVLASSKSAAVIPAVTDGPQYIEIESTRGNLETDALISTDNEMAPVETAPEDKGGEIAPVGEGTGTLSTSAKSKTFTFESDEDSSSDSVPDIVDADPNSDWKLSRMFNVS